MFIFFACLYALQGVYALFLRVQRKRTSSVLYGERKDSHSLAVSLLSAKADIRSLYPLEGCCLQRTVASESRGVYAPSESIANLRGAPPSRLSVLC